MKTGGAPKPLPGAGLKVGLAVSGGADSTALLVLMAGFSRKFGFSAEVLHVDHGLRRDSASDAAFVERLASRFGLPFHGFRTKVARRKGESVEMAARRVRLGFFADAMKRYGLDCIATGHHMDDVAETFLMRLKRASGARGLSGLRPVSFVDGIFFIRPLLNVRTGDLRAFLKSRGIAWREDCTNADTSILRNKVRHVVIPFLERELDPHIVERICRSAGYLRDMADGVPETADPATPEPVAASARAVETAAGNFTLEISPSSGYETAPQAIGSLPACAWMDAAALRGRTLEVRRWRSGDRMMPCGFPHHRKLQDIFVTAKTAPEIRRSLPILADAGTGEVLWIPGYRVAEQVKVPSQSAPSVKFTLSTRKTERGREGRGWKNVV